jgi:hypothetical protein
MISRVEMDAFWGRMKCILVIALCLAALSESNHSAALDGQGMPINIIFAEHL